MEEISVLGHIERYKVVNEKIIEELHAQKQKKEDESNKSFGYHNGRLVSRLGNVFTSELMGAESVAMAQREKELARIRRIRDEAVRGKILKKFSLCSI